MSKKRPSDAPVESEAPAKKEKAPEFNGTVFKIMLKNPTTAMKGLERFISTAKKLPSCDLYDVVEGYIKISMECAEIFKLLEAEKPLETEMMLIFGSLEVILLRTASDLSHFNMVGNVIVKKIASNYMKLLQGSFHSLNHGFVRQCLNLLSAMVSQGAEAAREVFSHVQIKTLFALAKRKDKRGKPDVRLAFIQFVLSFLVSGDSAIIGQVLEVKELLPQILNTGLKEDRMSTVNLILSTLKTRIVLNKAISKTQKVRFFTPAVLANIASLYKWNGIVDATADDDTMAENSDAAGISVVRDLVHRFLIDLCCSRKHGISFHDTSFGTSGRPGNLVLLQFLVGLKQATEDELVAELVVNILKESPDILSRFFKETQYSYTPRIRSAWHDNVKLLKRIYEAQPEISTIFHSGEMIPLPRLLSMVMVISLPPVCNKAFFTQGLNLSNSTVQLTTISMLNFILKKANKSIAYLLDKSVLHQSNLYTVEMMEELVQQYRETLGKILPDMTLIISAWQSLSKKEKADGGKKIKSEELADNKNEVPVAETAEVIVLKAFILQVICLYQKVVPHLVTQCKFDFSKLLKGIVFEKGMKEEIPPVLQYQILQLALNLPANKFSWFRLQDVANSESSSGEKSVLYLLLKMFVSNSSSHLSSTTRKLILKVLRDTGVFEYTFTEFNLWLDQLARIKSNQQDTVIQFLERVLVKLVCNSYDYTDRVAGFVQEAANIQANLSVQEGEAASVPVSHIDDVLDMLDVIMEGSEGEMEEFGPSLSEDLIIQTFPFSVAVPAALEARNKLPADKGVVCEYLSAVLSDLLHCQRDPLPLCLALQQYDKELVSSQLPPLHQSIAELHQYYARWLPQQCREELFKSSESFSKDLAAPSSYSSLIKAAYIQGPGALLEDSFRQDAEKALAVMSLSEFPVLIKQILLYIKSTVESFGTFSKEPEDAFLRTLMEMLQDVITKLQTFEETTSADPAVENSQEGSDLSLELNQSQTIECNKEQVVVSALGSVFKHPCLEQWFLARELSALPPHSLKPVALKRLCAQLTERILSLLKISAPALDELNHLELISGYMAAIERAALKELAERGSRPAKTYSKSFQALLSLHGYMDSSNLRELVSRLLLLPQESLFLPSTEGPQSELSVYGHVALQILRKCYSASSQNQNIFLTQAHFHGLGALLLSCSSPELDAFLLQALSSKPGSARLIHTDVLLRCLRRSRPDSLAVVSLLLQNSSSHRLCFEMWCEEPTNMEVLSETKVFLPLINTYLKVAQREDPARPKEVQKEVLKAMKQALLSKFSQSILGNLSEDHGVHLVETAASLIKLSADVNDIQALINNLPDFLQKAESFERWNLVDIITEKLADCTEEQEKWRRSVVAAALKCLIASYCHSKDQTVSPSDQEEGILKRLQQLLKSAEDISVSDWNSFVKNGLKYRYCNQHFLNTLSSLLEVMYGSAEQQKELIPLSSLHLMTTSHSQFLPVMLDSSEESNEYQVKEALVSLLLCVVEKCPKVCNINHFIVLLAAYGATLSTSDQKLLMLLRQYERCQVSLLKFQSLLWGPAAVEHHKTRKMLGASLWKQPSSDEVLALLKADKMLQTVLKFPQERRIIPQDGTELLHSKDAVENLGDLYDPCFLLPLFSAILQPECVIDCFKFVSCHALGVTVMALSSFDPNMRAAAYHVLACFYQHLEGARFREKRQLLYFMDNLKNGIPKQNQKLPFVLAVYISKVAQQMLRPEDHMYVVLNRFLLSHQSLDLRRVPEFFKLFYGFDLEHKVEREWILNLLQEGISDGHSYELCSHQNIFQVLLGFSSSPLCSEYIQAQIIKVLCQAAHVPKAVYDLTKSCGLLSWMIQVVDKKNLTQQTVSAVIDLLHTLWFTSLGQKEKKVDGNGAILSTDDEPLCLVKCLPLPLISEFLCVALAISRHLRLGVKAAQLSLFVQTLGSVLVHRGNALHVNKQADRLTLHPQPLSSTETLSLLFCWASLSHNSTIIAQIQALNEKHKIKELMGLGKYKVRSRGRLTFERTRDGNASEDSRTVKQEESLLAGCRVHLSSVFVYWQPVFQLSEPPLAQPGGKLDSRHLACDTAHLLTKWSLRWLVEDGYDENRTKDFLTWFEKAVIKQREIVDVLMLDPVVKADLLQLFHNSFEAPGHASMETCQLFTNTMIRLLEMRGQLPDLHRVIISACMSDQDQSRHEPGLFLLSLYIHELWSGSSSADLFLSHVTLVTRAQCKRQKGSKSTRIQTAIGAICSEIIEMKS
ncbi:nucleolar pre-ribosomal-associated protein 1 isoform X2 [Xiphophorus hellerii]|uniref:nucleolar pre-ribosomal-associated protein 1 isoform X2 n=1 Tax=Xiphophorus hellerii TaxID=8084 RepID=UPI0013B430C3|nr:nucleolar pre-ribosomal-associated protein 1 isoform X2 [Xiphophorus hellerii]